MSEIFIDHLKEEINKIPEGICCVCGHKLDSHIDEKKVWRCHSLGQDFYQCECALRKGRNFFDNHDLITVYDLKRRLLRQLEELKNESTLLSSMSY